MTQDTEVMTPEQEQAEWDALAAEKAGETPPAPAPTPAPAPGEEPSGEEPPPKEAEESTADTREGSEETPPDPLAGLPEGVKAKLAKLDELEQLVLRQSNDMKSAIGRVAAFQRELDVAKAAANAAGKAAPTQAQVEAAAKSPEKWEAMKADFPDWGEAIDELLNHRLAGLQPPSAPAFDPAQVESLVAQRVEATKASLQGELEAYKVELKHGDWRGTVNTPEFKAWFDAQDATTKLLADSSKGADAIRLLDKFEEARKKPVAAVQQERTSRLAQAATVKPGHTPPPKSEEDMTPEELWEHLAKQRLRASAG